MAKGTYKLIQQDFLNEQKHHWSSYYVEPPIKGYKEVHIYWNGLAGIYWKDGLDKRHSLESEFQKSVEELWQELDYIEHVPIYIYLLTLMRMYYYD